MENQTSIYSTNTLIMNLARKIISLREKKGYSRIDMAEACGLHPLSIQRLEEGKVNPSLRYLAVIAGGLGVETSALLEK
jgi:transcriptional regulator with XRE-family HTH domain